jgi:hypothetical protein
MYGTRNPTLLAVAGVQSHHVFITKEAKMAKKLSKTAQVTAYIKSNPTAATGYLAEKFGVKSAYISSLKWKLKKEGVAIPKAVRKSAWATKMYTTNKAIMEHIAPHIPVYEDSVEHVTPKRLAEIVFEVTRGRPPIMEIEPPADPVNHPAHYKAGGIETIDFIEAKKLGYNLGNVVKYITRADLKGNRKQDLEKALWYLKREIGAE